MSYYLFTGYHNYALLLCATRRVIIKTIDNRPFPFRIMSSYLDARPNVRKGNGCTLNLLL